MGVPKSPTLVMTFSQSMNRQSVQDSTLRITDVTGNDEMDGANWYLDIQVQQALNDGLIALDWNDSADPAYTEATLTLSNHTLVGGNVYRLQMVDNKAKGANGLSLILDGTDQSGTIDLLSGFNFRVNQAPEIDEVLDGGTGIANDATQGVQIDEGDSITLSVTLLDPDPAADRPLVVGGTYDGQHQLILTATVAVDANGDPITDNPDLLDPPNSAGSIAISADSTDGLTQTMILAPADYQYGYAVIRLKVSEGSSIV